MFKSKKKVGSTTAPENLRTIALSAFISNDLSSTLIIPTNARRKYTTDRPSILNLGDMANEIQLNKLGLK